MENSPRKIITGLTFLVLWPFSVAGDMIDISVFLADRPDYFRTSEQTQRQMIEQFDTLLSNADYLSADHWKGHLNVSPIDERRSRKFETIEERGQCIDESSSNEILSCMRCRDFTEHYLEIDREYRGYQRKVNADFLAQVLQVFILEEMERTGLNKKTNFSSYERQRYYEGMGVSGDEDLKMIDLMSGLRSNSSYMAEWDKRENDEEVEDIVKNTLPDTIKNCVRGINGAYQEYLVTLEDQAESARQQKESLDNRYAPYVESNSYELETYLSNEECRGKSLDELDNRIDELDNGETINLSSEGFLNFHKVFCR